MKDLASHKESYTIHTITVETFMIPKQLIVWIQYSIANLWLSLANSCVKIRIFVQTSVEPNLFEQCRVQLKITRGKTYLIVNKQVFFYNSANRHLQKYLYKWLCPKLSTNKLYFRDEK